MSISLTTIPGPLDGPFAQIFKLLKEAGVSEFKTDKYNDVHFKLPVGWTIYEHGKGNQYQYLQGDYDRKCVFYFIDNQGIVRFWFNRNTILMCFMMTDYSKQLIAEFPFTYPIPAYYCINKNGYLEFDKSSKEYELLIALQKLERGYRKYLDFDIREENLRKLLNTVRTLQKEVNYSGKEFNYHRTLLNSDFPITETEILAYYQNLLASLKTHPTIVNTHKVLQIIEIYQKALNKFKISENMIYLEWPSDQAIKPIVSFVELYDWYNTEDVCI